MLAELSGQSSVSEQAQTDQVAGQLWSALGSNLSQKSACSIFPLWAILRDQENLTEDNLKRFLSYFLNYDVEGLNLNQISYRYPHYNKTAILKDIEHFIHLELIE
ncbi:MAG: hypothetical protein R8G66_15535 [Cytophagales bacterium]|nr:hypothetical protein [Cytophagales bacterium]